MTKAPISLQDLRRRIYRKAKSETTHRFWGLFVHVTKVETLEEAYRIAKSNGGAAGVDGQKFEDIESAGRSGFLAAVREDLITGRYKPKPNRRVEIPKGNGKVRTLQIPCIRDRVVQGAVKLILEAVFEADFCTNSYGFLPRRSPHRALAEVRRSVLRRMSTVIDVDLSKYFDTIRHSILLDKIAKRVQDPEVMHLIKQIIKAAGKIGVPQGGPTTPLTQKITCAAARRGVVGSWRCVVSRGSRGYRDRVADDDGVVTDENLFDEQSDNTLTLDNVQRLRRGTQSRHERRQCFGQAQIRGAIICLVGERGQLRLQGLFAPAQLRHAGAQFIEREQGFLIGRHQPFHALAGTRQIALQGFLAPFVWTGSARSIQAPLDRSEEHTSELQS